MGILRKGSDYTRSLRRVEREATDVERNVAKKLAGRLLRHLRVDICEFPISCPMPILAGSLR
jgi:hypothetical protein